VLIINLSSSPLVQNFLEKCCELEHDRRSGWVSFVEIEDVDDADNATKKIDGDGLREDFCDDVDGRHAWTPKGW